jgi:peptide-O-fucosyltransferase
MWIPHEFIFFPFPKQKNIPFSDFFQVAPLQEYHRVILMEEFLEKLAPKYWPIGKRIGYCWLPPQSTMKCTLKVYLHLFITMHLTKELHH